ncbi:MAG: kinase [Bacillota bacterium]|nr:kinase [Bacillota bacterium]
MEESAVYPGSLGEILQGKLNGMDILVSCPINLFTKVRVFETRFPSKRIMNPKSSVFLLNLLKRWKLSEYYNEIDIEISSGIPKGKGFASSTADLCALYLSLIKLYKKSFDQMELVEECLKIEPSDSIIFDKMTVFDYKSGRYIEPLGNYLKFYALVFEGKKIIDTVQFNKNAKNELRDIDDLMDLLRNRDVDLRGLAQISTESILRNQNRLPYDILPGVIKFSKATNGLGILGAHSGDMLAVIYEDQEQLQWAYNKVEKFKGYKHYKVNSLRKIRDML